MTAARTTAALVAAAATLLTASGAFAQDTRAVVLDFEGRYADRLRSEAVRSLQGEVELVPQAEFVAAVSELETEDDFAEAASATGVSAILSAEIQRRGRNTEITLTLRGGDGEVLKQVAVADRNPRRLASLIRGGLWAQMGEDILSAPAPEAAPAAAEASEESGSAGSTANDSNRVLVLPFSGSGATQAQARLVGSLRDSGYEVEEVDADTPSERVEAALDFGARALVSGEVFREDATWFATLRVYDGYDGEEIDEVELEEEDAASMLTALETSADSLASAIESGEMPDEEALEDADDDEDSGPSGPRPSPLQAFAGVRFFNRDFSYNDDLAVLRPDPSTRPGLRSYSLPVGPALELDMVIYPFAFFMDGFLANIGIEGGLVYAFAIESEECRDRDEGTGNCLNAVQFPTSSVAWNVGARVRFNVDTHEFYGRVAYATQSFRIEALDVMNPAPEVPDVDYGMVRLGAGTRLEFTPIVIEPRAGLLVVTGMGQITEDDWFPNASALGVEAGLRLGYQLLDWLEVTAAFDFAQIGIAMNNEPGDNPNRVAGGATDRYISGSIGAQVRLPGSD